MSEADWKIPAIKYHQLHGLDDSHPYPKRNHNGSEFEIGSLPVFAWWRNRVENTFQKYESYSNIRILVQSFLFSLLVPFVCFYLIHWILWFCGTEIHLPTINPYDLVYAVIVAPILETLIIFFPLLELARLIGLPRWFSYPSIFIFFESLHDQRSFLEHPFMWMTGYMFIVAYEAGRTRSLLHAILFCAAVHEAYNLSCYLLSPTLYPTPF